MNILFLAIWIFTYSVYGDTPPPGTVNAKLLDSSSNGITSTVNGAKRGIDVYSINPASAPVLAAPVFGGSVIDPRAIRSLLNSADSVTAFQGGTWSSRTQSGSGTGITHSVVGPATGLDVNVLNFSSLSLGTVQQGTPNTIGNAWPVKLTNGTNIASVSATGAVKVDGSAVTQPVSGSVSVTNLPVTQPISGSVSVSNFPVTQPISGTVAVTQGTSPWVTSGTIASTQSGLWSTGRTWTLASGGDSVASVQSGLWSTGRTWNLTSGTDQVAVTQGGTWTVQQGTPPWAVSQSGSWTVQSRPYDGTNSLTKLFDNDSGAGVEYNLGVSLRKSASGGSIELGTSTDPIRTDTTGTTPQPSSQSGIWTVQQGTPPWAVSQSGVWNVRHQDTAGNGITSQVSGSQRPLDIGVVVGGSQIDPRVTRALTAADVVTANAGTGTRLVTGTGIAGTAAAGVVTVQGIAGGTPIPIAGTVTATVTNASVGLNAAVAPTSSSQAGGLDSGGLLRPLKVYDLDSNPTFDHVLGVNLRQTGVGGSVEIGTLAAPIRTDPTGVTAQPVSGTLSAAQSGIWSTRIQDTAGGTLTATAGNLGVQVANASLPVTQSGVWSVGRTWALTSGTDSIDSVQSGIWTVQPGNTANTTPWLTTISQGGNSAAVTGAGALKTDGSAITQPVSGTITANIGTAGTLALDATLGRAQASVTAAQTGPLIQGAVSSATPTYADATTNPLSLTPAGALRVDSSATLSTVVGNVSSGSTDSGAPVKIGGVFNTALPTFTNGQRGDLQIDSSGRLITSSNQAQGSTTSGQFGSLMQGAVTAASPTYTTGNTNPLSLDTSGNLRISLSASGILVQVVGASASGSAKSGNPVQTGAVFNTTQPTVTTGQTVENQATARGAQIVATGVDGFVVGNTQGSTTSGQSGPLIQGAVTTSAPSYTTGQTSPLSITPGGALRVTATSTAATDSSATGTITALNGTVVVPTAGTGMASVLITGTWVATLIPEISADGGTTYAPANWTTSDFNSFGFSTTANGTFRVSTSGVTHFRVKASAFTSGTATITLNAGTGSYGNVLPRQIPFSTDTGGFLQTFRSDTSGNLFIGGNVASGATDSGNPVKIGGKYNSTLPTFTNGQRGDLQIDASGRLIVSDTVPITVSNTSSYTNITTATTTTIKSGTGTLFTICINTPVNNATATVYDNTSAAAPIIAKLTAASGTTPFCQSIGGTKFNTGLTVVTTLAADWSFYWK